MPRCVFLTTLLLPPPVNCPSPPTGYLQTWASVLYWWKASLIWTTSQWLQVCDTLLLLLFTSIIHTVEVAAHLWTESCCIDDSDYGLAHRHKTSSQHVFHEGAIKTQPSSLFQESFLSPDNAPDVVEMIEVLLSNHSKLDYDELLTVLNKLKDVVNLSEVTPTMGQALIDIISNILQSDSNLLPFTNT